MKAWEVIDSPEKWCKASYAQDADGCAIEATNIFATSWCALGAIFKAYEMDEGRDSVVNLPAGRKLMLYLNERIGHSSIAVWNDGMEWETVYGTLKELDI